MSWLDNYSTTNTFRSMYINGFIDISGGRLQTRSVTDGHLFIAGDTSLNGNLFVGGDVSLSGTLTLTETNPVTFFNTSSLEMPFMVFNFTQLVGLPSTNIVDSQTAVRWDTIFRDYSKVYTNMHSNETGFYNQNDGQFGILLYPGIWEIYLGIPNRMPNHTGMQWLMGLDEDAGRDFDSNDEPIGNFYQVHTTYGQTGPEKHIVHVPFDGDDSGSATSSKAKVFHMQILGDNRQFDLRNNSNVSQNIYPILTLRCLHAGKWDGTEHRSSNWFTTIKSQMSIVYVNNNSVKWPRK